MSNMSNMSNPESPSPGPGFWRAADGNWYPPQAAPQAPHAPQAPAKAKKGCLWWLGLAVVILVVFVIGGTILAIAGSGGKSSTPGSGTSTHPAAADVTIASCTIDSVTQSPTADVQVLNHSSQPSNYIVQVIFQSDDGTQQYGTGTALVNQLAAGQSTSDTAVSFYSGTVGTLSCKLGDVTRMAS